MWFIALAAPTTNYTGMWVVPFIHFGRGFVSIRERLRKAKTEAPVLLSLHILESAFNSPYKAGPDQVL